ncbi:hypothetical protein GCM10022225_06380 [Plantactinospora mayteni]|uniref:DUF1702 family protein n=1 Tax=Plantactinospora mayteni TaxID=566021 RepID=A0ABQ4ER69_9ACTN|nr:DUF1702 family protein [Plantactinospora mayteni]GIG97128.1 hypothetical protein Pma05_37010 [Plantactinospora mayteni]
MATTGYRAGQPRSALTRRVVLALVSQEPARFEPLLDSFTLADRWQRERVRTVLHSFLRGYHAAARAREFDDIHADLAGLDRYYRPFGYEGAAMGFGPWAYLRRRSYRDFEEVMAAVSPHIVYQNYVGLGWWLAIRNRIRPSRTERIVEGLDPHYRLLPYEGWGFRAGFLNTGRPAVTRAFHRFGEDAMHVCHQGYGRSLWFVCMGDLGRARTLVESLPPGVRGDCYSGIGLGFAYSWLDRAGRVAGVLAQIPPTYRSDFLQGAAFGWEARQLADRPMFDELVGPLDPALRGQIEDSLTAVADARRELDARGEHRRFYQAWREETRARLPARIGDPPR